MKVTEKLSSIEGWLDLSAFIFAEYYRDVFLRDQVFDCLEIGVHHGKFFIGIENITPVTSRAVAIDLFSMQDRNIDFSGYGNLKVFLTNVSNFALEKRRVIYLEQDSLDLIPSELGFGRFGIISIDGGHTEQHTLNDLMKAQDLITPTGLIALDDILNQDWLGVVCGATKFFSSPVANRITPFAVGFNKLFCCHFSHANTVKRFILEDSRQLNYRGIEVKKISNFCGNDILSLGRV